MSLMIVSSIFSPRCFFVGGSSNDEEASSVSIEYMAKASSSTDLITTFLSSSDRYYDLKRGSRKDAILNINKADPVYLSEKFSFIAVFIAVSSNESPGDEVK